MRGFIVIMILVAALLPGCTNKEFAQMVCEKPDDWQTRLLCWVILA